MLVGIEESFLKQIAVTKLGLTPVIQGWFNIRKCGNVIHHINTKEKH